MNSFSLIILCFGAVLISGAPDGLNKETEIKNFFNCSEVCEELHKAATYGDVEKIRELLENGTDVDIVDADGRTSLHLAAKYDQYEVADFLIEKDANIESKSNENRTPLFMASSTGNTRIVELLLNNLANVNVRDKKLWTPLHAAANLGNLEILKLLLNNQANVNYQTNDGETAIFLASYFGHSNLVATLLDNDANVNLQNNDGLTPLAGASLAGFDHVVEILVENGTATDINIPDRNQSTPLHMAVDNGHEKVVEYLLKKGANIDVKNVNGDTPKDLAYRKENPKIIKVLKQFYAIQTVERACSTFSTLDRIIGGTPVGDTELPWMAYLRISDGESMGSCGGTIISRYFILTAAHCVGDVDKEESTIRIGKVSLDDGDEDNVNVIIRKIKEIYVHPDYSTKTHKNDIALIKVTKRIPFSKYIRPACLQTDMRDEPTDVKLIASGWGRTSSGFWGVGSRELLKTELNTVSLSECNQTLFNYEKKFEAFTSGLIKGQYCARDPKGEKNICKGDSGGPLQLISNGTNGGTVSTVVGIVSLADPKCETDIPAVFTRVAYYLDWIVSHVWSDE